MDDMLLKQTDEKICYFCKDCGKKLLNDEIRERFKLYCDLAGNGVEYHELLVRKD
jgi:hypothetical protein